MAPWRALPSLISCAAVVLTGALSLVVVPAGRPSGQEAPAVIPHLRKRFNQSYSPDQYANLLTRVEERCGAKVEFRLAETPVFLDRRNVEEMAALGAELASRLIGDPVYMQAAQRALPRPLCMPREMRRPHFLTAVFALARTATGELSPRLMDLEAVPPPYAFQAVLAQMYKCVFELEPELECFLGGLDRDGFLELLSKTILGGHDPLHVVLAAREPDRHKLRPDFAVIARKLGVTVIDIDSIEPQGERISYRNANGKQVTIERIYNCAKAEEWMSRNIPASPADVGRWDVEWAGDPRWSALLGGFSLPWLTRWGGFGGRVPAAVYLDEFLAGEGRRRLESAGVDVSAAGLATVYDGLVLKPLFARSGAVVVVAPSQARLEAVPPMERSGYVVQERVRSAPAIDTPAGGREAEIRILYLWPDRGTLRAVLPMVRLRREAGTDESSNAGQAWTGHSAAFFPA